ncbi:excalibur calcium-binding domain-containing protein [Ectopseudomonas mendocina]|uniref:excalibur calcium-binding domain-containing protein n=1 Tax=Ectopseudomonas mendocina TaxID=300 RepID=UPI0005A6587E|nr:excalibur calcium-binding domain-containing protein [Pseudomonas mendocina]VEE14526.1 excalibur domain-containing protein [Pseudomonas mendocina]
MQKLIIILLLGAAFWQFYLSKPGNPIISNVAGDGSVMDNPEVTQPGASSFSIDNRHSSSSLIQPAAQVAGSSYRCDGRTHCSQMTSCAEATFFLRNCPGTRMDGDNDGVPCEGQWCGR